MLSAAVPVKYRTRSSLTESPGRVEMSLPRCCNAPVRTSLDESEARFRNTGVRSRRLTYIGIELVRMGGRGTGERGPVVENILLMEG